MLEILIGALPLAPHPLIFQVNSFSTVTIRMKFTITCTYFTIITVCDRQDTTTTTSSTL